MTGELEERITNLETLVASKLDLDQKETFPMYRTRLEGSVERIVERFSRYEKEIERLDEQLREIITPDMTENQEREWRIVGIKPTKDRLWHLEQAVEKLDVRIDSTYQLVREFTDAFLAIEQKVFSHEEIIKIRKQRTEWGLERIKEKTELKKRQRELQYLDEDAACL